MPKPILIAVGEPAEAENVKRALERAHVANPLPVVHNGAEVISCLQGEGIYADRTSYPYPGLLMLDWQLPGKSGVEVLEWLRIHSQHKELVVIVLMGRGQVRELRQAYELGAQSFLGKPVAMEELLSLLTVLKGRGAL